MILIHDAVPHHHESEFLVKMFCDDFEAEGRNHRHTFYFHSLESNNPSSSQSCEKSFPPHHHLDVADGYIFVRSEHIDIDVQTEIVVPFLCAIDIISCDFAQPLFYELELPLKAEQLTFTQFTSEAISLRGPPALS